MAISLRQARPYLSSSEAELVHWSTSKRVEALTPARLRQKLDRARKLRDKYRGLGDRQRREARGKQSPRGQRGAEGNSATRMKQELFSETAERFEKALEAAGTPLKQRPKKTERKAAKKVSKKAGVTKKAASKKVSKKAGTPAAATQKKSASKKVSKKKTASKTTPRKKLAAKKVVAKAQARKKANRRSALSEATEGKRKQTAMLKAGQVRFQGHVSSRGRRNQAKRDSRGRR
ncbi:MAG: hypothetical protein EA380_09020 [Phycisphaeraceae bacterium]|nr:MAG: hypothetical protein EA380_09020 [Phycisphaeraceae bacterium]